MPEGDRYLYVSALWSTERDGIGKPVCGKRKPFSAGWEVGAYFPVSL